jgi:hypothetical protein
VDYVFINKPVIKFMCSATIIASNSCYIDNWTNILELIQHAVSMGIVFAVIIGIIFFMIKKA